MRQVINYDLWSISADSEFVVVNTRDFRNLVFTIVAEWITTWATLTVYSSNMEEKPDLSTNSSDLNEYAATQSINLDTHTLINWITWIVLSSDWTTRYELNENLNSWVWIKITSYTDWQYKIKVQMSTND